MSTIAAGRSKSAPRVAEHPSWCDGRHSADVDGNFFHRGPIAVASVPESAAVPTLKEDGEVPLLTAHLVLPEGPEGDDEPPQITVDTGDLWGPYAELDVDQADEFLHNLKTFTVRVEQMRDQLAALKGERS